MDDSTHTQSNGPRVFVYRGTVPPLLALLVVAPLLLVFLSLAAALLAGGAAAALILPVFLRGRRLRPRTDTDCIELDRDQYTRVETDRRQLPPK